MKFKTKEVKVIGKIISDLVALFARLLVEGGKERMELSTLFNYKLSPVPASIIDEYGCLRNGNKSMIINCLESLLPSLHPPDVLVDSLQLIYHVVWPSSGAVADLAASLGHRLDSYIVQTFVIFDRYEQVSSAKDDERQRIAGESSTEYQLSLTTSLPSCDKVMKDKTNKQRLGKLLCTHNIGDHIKMVSSADSFVTNINLTEENLGEDCGSILAMQALSGFDNTSYPVGEGKVSALKAMTVVPGDFLHFIGEEGVTDLQTTEAVRVFFLALHKHPPPPSTEDTASYRAQHAPPWMLLLSFWTLSAVAAKLQACTSNCFCKGDDSIRCNTHSKKSKTTRMYSLKNMMKTKQMMLLMMKIWLYSAE